MAGVEGDRTLYEALVQDAARSMWTHNRGSLTSGERRFVDSVLSAVLARLHTGVTDRLLDVGLHRLDHGETEYVRTRLRAAWQAMIMCLIIGGDGGVVDASEQKPAQPPAPSGMTQAERALLLEVGRLCAGLAFERPVVSLHGDGAIASLSGADEGHRIAGMVGKVRQEQDRAS